MNKIKSIFTKVVLGITLSLSLFFVQGAAQASQVCNAISEMAYNLQKARQVGVSMSKSMQIAESLNTGKPGDKQAVSLIKQMIVRAYEIPRFNNEENQETAAQEFSNMETVRCYRSTV